jgi:type IV pilus assembly protein PilZ
VTGARCGAKPVWVKDRLTDDAEDLDSADDPENRRSADRFSVAWSVDCETEDTFLYASIRNISELGIFVATRDPLAIGTRVTLRFAPPNLDDAFVLGGVVQWVNPVRLLSENRNPGMGIRFVELMPPDRERLVEAIRTIAYVRADAPN